MILSTVCQLVLVLLILPFVFGWVDMVTLPFKEISTSLIIKPALEIVSLIMEEATAKEKFIFFSMIIYPLYSIFVFGVTSYISLVKEIVNKTFIPLVVSIIFLPLIISLMI